MTTINEAVADSRQGPTEEWDPPAPLSLLDDRTRKIRITSRMGVWGLIAGVSPVLAATFGVGTPAWWFLPVLGAGLVVSGVGTTLASWHVMKALDGRRGLLRAAALTGIPLGLSVGAYGATALLGWAPLVRSLGTIVPTAIVLGALVIVLLVGSFLLDWVRRGDGAREGGGID